MTRIFFKPWVAALGLAVAAALVVLNFAAASFGTEQPWLAALASEVSDARARTTLDESHTRLTSGGISPGQACGRSRS